MMAHPATVVVANGAAGTTDTTPAGLVASSASSASPPAPNAQQQQQPTSTDADAEVEKRHAALCLELCMDKTATLASWHSYSAVRLDHQLEGDQMHWLSCSLYIACRAGRVPTVGRPDATVEGNCVSLTHLLRACKITFLEFFQRMERWMELVDCARDFRDRIERLKQKLLVSLLVYDKYQKIFKDLFVGLQADEQRKRKKTVATTPCSSRKLYDFCWYLFLCAKSEYPENSVDLVTTFNMLLCCVDLVFANIVADRRGDLVNANLYTDPQWNTDELLQAADAADAADAAHATPRKRICTIGLLCKLYDGPVIDAMETKQYAWSGVLRRFCAEKVLRCSPPAAATATADGSNGSGGSAGEFLGLLTVENFDANLSALKNMYKRYFLSVGEIDEGILLTQVENSTMTHNLKRQTDESKKQLMPPTPLTRRYYLPGKDAGSQAAEPVDMATRSVQRLRGALGTYDPEPPASLAGLLAQCPDDPLPKMRALRNQMIAQFCVRFETNARERFELAEMLYYRLLENILRREQASRQSFDFKILRHDVFHATLLTCSVEIVIHAYMGQKRFPWVLECFAVEAYHFYKIIEMIVLNHGDILSRDVIKHLNAIEEKCIDSLVWRSSSPLWDQIKQCDQLPERQDADIPKPQQQPHHHQQPQQQHQHHNHQQPRSAMERLLQSPIDVAERFHAETPNGGEHVAKQLFKTAASAPVRAGVLPAHCGGSMKLFFRKFYKLAYLRMVEICRHLNYLNDQFLQKIWTIFEYSITKETELMRDRHLDQILMCAIYVFGRNGKFQTTFKDIMLSYRKQPQTTSDVYRDVHMTEADIAFERQTTPATGAGAAIVADPAAAAATKKYDIISFYNFCYVRSMQEFVMSTKEDGMLSPLPTYANQLMSPRRVSENHSLYIQPFEPRELPLSPNVMTYSFKASPVERQNYGQIQRLLGQASLLNSHGKRELPFEQNGTENGGSALAFKVSRLVSVVGAANNGGVSSGGVSGSGGSDGGGVTGTAAGPLNTERVPYIREKLQKIITDRQCNN